MDAKLAETLADFVDAEIYEDYSGRGMFGKTTTGLVVDNITELLAAVINNADLLVEQDDEYPEALFSINGFRVDSMGTQTIVY